MEVHFGERTLAKRQCSFFRVYFGLFFLCFVLLLVLPINLGQKLNSQYSLIYSYLAKRIMHANRVPYLYCLADQNNSVNNVIIDFNG